MGWRDTWIFITKNECFPSSGFVFHKVRFKAAAVTARSFCNEIISRGIIDELRRHVALLLCQKLLYPTHWRMRPGRRKEEREDGEKMKPVGLNAATVF